MAFTKLSHEIVEGIVRRARKGESYAALAREHGVTLQAISYHVRRAGLRPKQRHLSPGERQGLTQRFLQGESVEQLAEEFGVSSRTVHTHADRETGRRI